MTRTPPTRRPRTDAMTFRCKKLLVLLGLALVGVLGFGGYFAYVVVDLMVRGDRSMNCEYLLHDVLEVYVRKHRRWPSSWDDLRATPLPNWKWPGEWPDVEQYVAIDFGLTLEQAASQDEAHFTAVRPVGPHLTGFARGFMDLVRRLHEEVTAGRSRKLP